MTHKKTTKARKQFVCKAITRLKDKKKVYKIYREVEEVLGTHKRKQKKYRR